MTPNRTPRPIVPSNQLRSLAHIGGFTVVVSVPATRLETPARKRRRASRSDHAREGQ